MGWFIGIGIGIGIGIEIARIDDEVDSDSDSDSDFDALHEVAADKTRISAMRRGHLTGSRMCNILVHNSDMRNSGAS